MALPTSRDTNYSAGSQVLSADLNNIQDCIVDAAHGSREVLVSPTKMQGETACTFEKRGTGATDYHPIWRVSPGGRLFIPLDTPVNATVDDATVFAVVPFGETATLRTMYWYWVTGSGNEGFQLGTTSIVTTTGEFAAGGLPHSVGGVGANLEQAYLIVDNPGTNSNDTEIYGARFTYSVALLP